MRKVVDHTIRRGIVLGVLKWLDLVGLLIVNDDFQSQLLFSISLWEDLEDVY